MTDEMSYDAKPTSALTAEVAQMLVARGWRLTTAESCTGGNLAAALCAQADTAAFYDTGVVTFSDEAKRNVLQVRAETLAVHSAVSEACVQEMSAGILAMADADAWNFRGQTETKRMCFAGDCETVVAKAVRYALAALSEKLAHWQ
ncbi:MAG: nicotinamide-nucleotide amidohydrolase family protein [Klebsiella sp.]|nr:nicotinamide-nucleotide amidohydrolase family protein [Klebsiella sp.]